MNKTIVDELNTFLKGHYMAIQAYERYIKHIQDKKVKQIFQTIQKNHQNHAQLIKKRILELNGQPVESVGVFGRMVNWMDHLKKETTELTHIIKDAQTGEYRGIKKSKQMLKNDLDEESLTLVKCILEQDEEHISMLTSMLSSEKSSK